MELIAFLVLVVSAVAGLILAALPRSKGHRVMVVSISLGFPLLIFLGDEAVGQIYLKVRCTVEGGHKIIKTVEAEGYFDASRDSGCALECLEALSRRGFDYYEAEARDQYQYHAAEKGIYRFQIIDQAQGGCAGGRAIPREPEFVRNGKCVAATRLQQIEAKFELSKIKETEIGPGFFKAQKVYSYIKDSDSGQLVGSATSFRYWGGWVRKMSFGHNSASVCPTYADSHAALRRVLTPRAR